MAKVNETADPSAIQELIETSRLGEENAGNISADVWEALISLKNSNVKLSYTKEELLSLRNNLTTNGFPQEVISALKQEGWTDEEIKALKDYIASTPDYYFTDFDMEAFLKALSDSFIFVGQKYAKYETWAVERRYWTDPITPPSGGTLTGNPYLSLSGVYNSIISRDAESLEYSVTRLRNTMLDLVSASTSHYKNGGIKLSTVTITSSGKTVKTYYWPNTLDAYKLTGELYTISIALKRGNSNSELWDLAMEYYDRLLKETQVYLISSSFTPAPSPGPRPMPVPLDATQYPTTYTTGTFTKPILTINSVDIVKVSSDFGTVRYKVVVNYEVSSGAVIVDRVTFNTGSEEYTLTGADLPEGSILYPGSGKFESRVFETPIGGMVNLSIPLSGIVTIRYAPATSPGGDTPLGSPGDPSLRSTSNVGIDSYQSTSLYKVVKEGYIGKISLVSEYDPEKVRVVLTPSEPLAQRGSPVEYILEIHNDNSLIVEGYYSVYGETMVENTPRVVQLASGKITIKPGEMLKMNLGSLTYTKIGTYRTFATFRFGDFEKSTESRVKVVEDTGSKVVILDAGYSGIPKQYQVVTPWVLVKNTDSKQVTVVANFNFNGEFKTVSKLLNPGETANLSVSYSLNDPGEYEIEVTVRKAGNTFPDDTVAIPIRVWHYYDTFGAEFEVWPTELEGGGEVYFTANVWNFENSTLPLSGFVVDDDGAVVKRIDGFEGRVPANANNYTLAFSLNVYGVSCPGDLPPSDGDTLCQNRGIASYIPRCRYAMDMLLSSLLLHLVRWIENDDVEHVGSLRIVKSVSSYQRTVSPSRAGKRL